MTPAESWAIMSATGVTKKAWRLLCKNARKLKAKIYSSYEEVTAYRYDKCTPKGTIDNGKDEVLIPMQAALDHQVCRLFSDDPDMKSRAVTLNAFGALLEYFFKYGSDGK